MAKEGLVNLPRTPGWVSSKLLSSYQHPVGLLGSSAANSVPLFTENWLRQSDMVRQSLGLDI